jgi:3-oxoacyl-[acyl-carrier-protein] synthase II
MNEKRVVVTGLGVVSSIGIGKDSFWTNLLKGKSGISRVESFDTSGHKTHVGGEIKGFHPEEFIDKKRTRFFGRTSSFAIVATDLALKNASLDRKYVSKINAGVCLGTTMGEIQPLEDSDHRWIKSGFKEVDKMNVFKARVNNVPVNISSYFKLHGPNRILTTACASGNYAIGHGYDLLRSGDADMMLVGGADAFSWISFSGFNKVGVTSDEKCQPFDKNRKGMIPGEGAAILVLESLEHALDRNAEIYAEILGYGLSCDASHMTNPHVDGVADCMFDALKRTGLNPKDVDYISAHGTGTPFNDKTESGAINKVFGDIRVPVSSIKSMLGHTMGAASAIGALTCCLAIKNDIVPPTINFETVDPECNIDCVPNMPRKQRVNVALNNGLAFGGNNACLVMRKFNERSR